MGELAIRNFKAGTFKGGSVGTVTGLERLLIEPIFYLKKNRSFNRNKPRLTVLGIDKLKALVNAIGSSQTFSFRPSCTRYQADQNDKEKTFIFTQFNLTD